MSDNSSTVILITRNGMGEGPQELQHRLIATYLKLLLENNDLPAAIAFYTEGVRLAAAGSPVLDQLRALENKGVHLVLCSTCLNYYGLQEQVQVGIVGGMTDILEAQLKADKVISI
jgi:selenium metabolism protein YedF